MLTMNLGCFSILSGGGNLFATDSKTLLLLGFFVWLVFVCQNQLQCVLY